MKEKQLSEFGPFIYDHIKKNDPRTLQDFAKHLGIHTTRVNDRFPKNNLKLEEIYKVAEYLGWKISIVINDEISFSSVEKMDINRERNLLVKALGYADENIKLRDEINALREEIAQYESNKSHLEDHENGPK